MARRLLLLCIASAAQAPCEQTMKQGGTAAGRRLFLSPSGQASRGRWNHVGWRIRCPGEAANGDALADLEWEQGEALQAGSMPSLALA